MSLIFMDSCQGREGTGKWSSGSFAYSTATPRFTNGVSMSGSSPVKTFTAVSEVFVAFAVNFDDLNAPTGATVIFRGDGNATTHLTLMRNSSSQLELRRGTNGGTVIATGTTVLPEDQWHHIQVRVTIADSGGVCQVRVNGSGSNEINFSGDTKNAGTNTTVDAVAWSSSSGFLLTDFVILSTAGSVNNTWPGDVRIYTLSPNADGATSDGTGSDGNSTNNYQLVDELPVASADYVGVTTDGNGDSYGLTDLPAGVTDVRAVQVNLYAAKSDAGAKSIVPRLRFGGTTYDGTSRTLTTTYATYTQQYDADPSTAAWTASTINSMEAGFEAAA